MNEETKETKEYKRGILDAVQFLVNYSDEARRDKRYQAANYLNAAAQKLARDKIPEVVGNEVRDALAKSAS